jgi:hypothetical protein
MREWKQRNPIVANLLNPAFCGEIIRRTARAYNKSTNTKFPFAFTFIVLPILLHKKTRERMPTTTRSYLFAWVEDNEDIFYDFSKRAKSMVPFTKESLLFLLQNNLIKVDKNGQIEIIERRMKRFKGDDLEEINSILKKSEMLGKWLSSNSNVNSVYSFFRITP